MDGLTALSLLMAERPVPVVMVSSLTEKGALATFEALALGAVEYVTKPEGTISLSIDRIRAEMVAKVRAAARARPKTARGLRSRIRAERSQAAAQRAPSEGSTATPGVVVIGVSTGGPRTLEDILPLLPGDFPWPVLVAQHMPASFTLPFAVRMNDLCALTVVEVARPLPLEPGSVYIGKGGADMLVTRRGDRMTVLPRPENKEFLWHPSVELLGLSVLEHCEPSRVVAVLLTGMGHDGSDAFTALRKKGARTIAESEESAVVFGMPAELIARGGASVVLPADKIANQIIAWAR